MAADMLPLEPADCRRWQRASLIAGGAGLALCAVGWAIESQRAAAVRSYLWAYNYWLGIALGSLVLSLLQYLTGGVWGLVLRRILEAATRTLPLMALFFVPIALSTHSIYIWADPELVEHDHVLQHKSAYLNVPFFQVRAAVCFAIWIGLATVMNRWAAAQDRPDAPDQSTRMRKLSAAGLAIYLVSITVASVDWVMSLEPHWYSSIFGVLFGVGQILSAFSFAIVALLVFADRPPLPRVLGRPIFRDLGSLLLAFVMVWAYLGFSQFLLIWSGNLPIENPYYLRRMQGGWQYVGLVLFLVNFVLPFVLLLSGEMKRDSGKLMMVAALVLGARMLDQFWLVAPAQPGTQEGGLGAVPFSVTWTDIAAPIGVGGIWLATFLEQLQERPLLPSHDPLLEEAPHHE